MRILLLEDDLEIGQNIAIILRANDYAVDLVNNISDAYELASEHKYDVLIFDRKIKTDDSAELVTKLRREEIGTPILLLTALSSKEELVKGLNLGADDYLAKPFDSRELLARIRALARRNDKLPTKPIIVVGTLQIDTNSHQVKRDDVLIDLSPREYAILEYLAQNKGVAIERIDILTHAWDDTIDLFSNTLDVHIAYLRKKIDTNHKLKLIQTIKGKGYMLCEN